LDRDKGVTGRHQAEHLFQTLLHQAFGSCREAV